MGANAQVATGTPQFGSFGGGPFDTINLGNLNVHFAIPVRSKTGRGTPFTYALVYDSSIWEPVTSSGTTSWEPYNTAPGNTPNSYWGWQGLSNSGTSYIAYNVGGGGIGHCGPMGEYQYQAWNFFNFIYYDQAGAHPFPNVVGDYIISPGGSECPPNGPEGVTSGMASDGSGLTLNVTYGYAGAPPYYGYVTGNLVTKKGAQLYPPIASNPSGQGSYSSTDWNGNQITATNGVYTDTLGQTALTVLGTEPNNTTLSYAAPSSATATYTVSYKAYTIKTNFGCSGVTEYNVSNVYLVNEVELPDGTSYQFGYEQTAGGSSSQTTGRLTSVSLPTGASITYFYPLTSSGHNPINCSDGSVAIASGGNPSLTRVVAPGGIDPNGTWTYSRAEGSPSNLWTTTVADPNGNQTSINFSEDASAKPTYNFYEIQRVVNQLISGTQTPLLTQIICYNGVDVGTPSSCPSTGVSTLITRRTIFKYVPTSSGLQSETDITYDAGGLGLVEKVDAYDYGSAAVGAKLRTTLISYGSYNSNGTCSPLGNMIVADPCTVIVQNGSGSTLAETTYSYDQTTLGTTSGTPQHIAITGSRGNLTTKSSYTSSTTTLSQTFTYYDTGNPNVATAVNGAQTTYVYGTGSCGNSFATKLQEPLSLSRSIQWNCIGGVLTELTDENSNNVTSDYTTDPDFWRPDSVTDQLGNQTKFSYTETTLETALQNFNGGHSAADVRNTTDGFGRPIFSQRLQQPGGSNYDTYETDYNNLGQPYRSTMPYTAAASPSSSNTTVAATTVTYDALGRVLTTTDADGGSVTYTYTKNDVLQQVSGGQAFQKQFEYDGLGRLTSVCEISGTLPGVGTCGQRTTQTGYWTKYTYDALGDLLTVTQNAQASTGQQNRSFTYDSMRRMLTESNPESGTKTYVYDISHYSYCGYTSLGSLMEVVDNAGSHICYERDALGRLGTSYNPDSTGQWHNCRNISYGEEVGQSRIPGWSASNTNSLGRVAFASIDYNCNGGVLPDEWFSYDKTGRITDVWEATPNSGGYYHSTASYWANGALNTLGLLNSSGTALIPAQTYGVDSEGRPNLVSAASGQNPVTSVSYSTGTPTAPLGALTGVTFGSADSDAFTYDPNTGRMASYTFSVNSKTDTGTLTWNTNGTLQKLVINDQIPGTSDSQTCTYGYDDAQRVSGVTCGTFWVQNFTYDAFGNITKNVPNGDGGLAFLPTYWTSPANNQFETLPGVTPQYDPVGNLLTDNLNHYTWDGYGSMATVSTGSTTVTATYDALGQMVENNAGGTYTQFVYGPTGKLAKCHGQTLVKAFVALPGGAKAIYNASGLAYYRHSDWLGTSRLTSTASRTMYSSSAYAPFGEQYATSGTADASFTGQDQDTVSNLYDFPARRQSPSQGRWISPDPAGRAAVSLANPQSWNRYAYVNNNPLRLIDPMGLLDCDSAVRQGGAHAMDNGGGCGDDSSGGGGASGGGDDDDDGDNGGNGDCQYDACVTAPDPGQNPCIMAVGGVDDSTGDLAAANTMGGVASYPLGQDVVGGFNDLGTTALGVASVGNQSFTGSNQSTNQFLYDYGNVTSQNSNVIVVAWSGGAQTFATGLGAYSSPAAGLGGVTGVIYVSPSAPGGFPNTGGIPTMTFNGGGVVNAAVQATNVNGEPGPVNPIPGCDTHSAGCEVFGPNGVLNGVQSDCSGQGGNDSSSGPANVGELVDPGEDGNDRFSTTEVRQRENQAGDGTAS